MQRGELEQLEVADDGVRDVEVGVEAQLAEPAADLGDGGEQLVAQHPERRLERLGRPEQLLLARPPTRRRRRSRASSANGDGCCSAPRSVRSGKASTSRRRARVMVMCRSRRISAACVALLSGGHGLLDQRLGDRLERAAPRAGHARGHQAEHVDVVELEALGGVHRHHAHAGRPLAAGRLLLAQAGVGDGGDRAAEIPARGLRRAAHVVGGQLGELGQVLQPLDDLGRRGEEQLAAQAEPLDEPVDVEVGARGVDRRRRRRGAAAGSA